jgi:hypothetical protein
MIDRLLDWTVSLKICDICSKAIRISKLKTVTCIMMIF